MDQHYSSMCIPLCLRVQSTWTWTQGWTSLGIQSPPTITAYERYPSSSTPRGLSTLSSAPSQATKRSVVIAGLQLSHWKGSATLASRAYLSCRPSGRSVELSHLLYLTMSPSLAPWPRQPPELFHPPCIALWLGRPPELMLCTLVLPGFLFFSFASPCLIGILQFTYSPWLFPLSPHYLLCI